MRQLLGRQYLEIAMLGAPGEVRRVLTPAVHHHDTRCCPRRGEIGRSGMGDVMRDESHDVGVEPGKRGAQKEWRALRIERPESFPLLRQHVVAARRESWVV